MSLWQLAPDRSIFILAGAAFCFYISSRLGADALRPRIGQHDAGPRALAHWLPTAAVAIFAVNSDPALAVSVIFASTIACLALALGATLLASPQGDSLQ